MEPMVFNIPAENMEALEKKLKSLNKKAKRAGTGELTLTVVSETAEKQDDGYVNVFKQVVVEGEAPKIEGWTFLARLDHNVDPTGNSNLVYVMPGQSLPEGYRNRPADCDHCGWTRKRRDTYVLRHDATSDLKQVGRTCIQDFIGIDPEKVLAHAERLASLYDKAKDAESVPLDRSAMHDRRFIDLEVYLTHVAMAIRMHGWVSGKEAYDNHQVIATRNQATETMFPTPGYDYENELEDEDLIIAQAAIQWALSQDATKNDFTHNMVTIATTGYIDFKATGTAAYIVQGYIRSEEVKKPTLDLSGSDHFAQKGDKIRGDVEVISKKVLPMKDWDQFQKTIVRMLSTDGGNLIVTFSTGNFGDSVNVGDKITIRGTVTKNDTFNDVKQTIVNRVRIVE